ncbi:MAG: ATP-binding protein [Mesorhizobium sp.]|uniref:AlbA family DNA-binding domain-containing protein n=1 Tax=Mesorhizobium sp. TaxID=1871066 RepID=UPI0011F65E1D|nr:ATP-binding protein [Mesorhizobium sp.]TIR26890.1 MAG: ATP-binding protein [Mesorhizobium sp.]
MEIAAFTNRPAADWTIADLEAVGQAKLPESLTLEFKGDFEAGAEERWRKNQDQISAKSRDRIAEEIVAFANAYGGVLLLGVKEKPNSDGIKVSAGLGIPIPSVAQCAERLEQSLRAVIDPPLPLLDVKAVKATDDGSGYIVFKVSQSLSAPHGVGLPAAGHVRRGSACQPMTMRDLQSIFWEARTAIDRVNDTFRARRQDFNRDLVDLRLVPGFPTHVLYRFTVVPARHFQVPHLPSVFLGREFGVREVPFQTSQIDDFTFRNAHWRPAAGGVMAFEHFDQDYKQVRIWGDGTWSLMGRHIVGHLSQFPGWYAVGGLWLLYNALRFRRRQGFVDTPLYIEGEIFGSKDREVYFSVNGSDGVKAPWEPALTDRLELGRDHEFDDVAQLFAEQVGWACGLDIDFSNLRLGPNLNLPL